MFSAHMLIMKENERQNERERERESERERERERQRERDCKMQDCRNCKTVGETVWEKIKKKKNECTNHTVSKK